MKPCEECEDSPGNGDTCTAGCLEVIRWYAWRMRHEAEADPQEERGLDYMIDDREV